MAASAWTWRLGVLAAGDFLYLSLSLVNLFQEQVDPVVLVSLSSQVRKDAPAPPSSFLMVFCHWASCSNLLIFECSLSFRESVLAAWMSARALSSETASPSAALAAAKNSLRASANSPSSFHFVPCLKLVQPEVIPRSRALHQPVPPGLQLGQAGIRH